MSKVNNVIKIKKDFKKMLLEVQNIKQLKEEFLNFLLKFEEDLDLNVSIIFYRFCFCEMDYYKNLKFYQSENLDINNNSENEILFEINFNKMIIFCAFVNNNKYFLTNFEEFKHLNNIFLTKYGY